jgi:hypothetical protein
MARWDLQTRDENPVPVLLPTEFNYYEGALARTLGLPTLVLVQSDVRRRVVFDMNFAGYLGLFEPDADVAWIHTEKFQVPFGYWKEALDERVDVFLGYCSRSKAIAEKVNRYLQSLGAKVLDWETDFIPGRTILEQIEQAAKRSVGGIFLFTKDDDFADGTATAIAAPRGNVVFEAGYFIGVKGKRNILIVRENGSKMPADLGGDIYASLPDRESTPPDQVSTAPIERTLRAFVEAI